jgi:hypothetical protein
MNAVPAWLESLGHISAAISALIAIATLIVMFIRREDLSKTSASAGAMSAQETKIDISGLMQINEPNGCILIFQPGSGPPDLSAPRMTFSASSTQDQGSPSGY